MTKSNMRKLGIILTLTLIFGLMASTIAIATEGEELTVEEAVQMALAKSLEVKIAGLNLENAEIDFQKSQANNLMAESRYIQMQSELSLAQAQDVYRQNRNNVLINTVKDYYQLLLLETDQAIKAKQITLEQRLLEESQIQVNSGHLGHLDLLKQDSRHQNAIFNLEKAEADEQQLMRKLATAIGLKPEVAWDVQLTPITIQPITLTEDEAFDEALNHSFTLQLREGRLDLAQVDLERAQARDTAELDLAKIKNQLEIAELEYQQAREEIRQSIQNQYFLFQQTKKRLELAQQTYQQSQENYQIVQKQKEAGLKTANDLLMAELNLLQEDYNRQNAQMNVLLNQLQLQKLMGIEIEVVIDAIIN